MKLGVLADLHWSVAPEASARWHAAYDFDGLAARCAAAVDALVARGCELLVVAGDLTNDGDEASAAAALDCILSASPVPVAVVEGNHDVLRDPQLLTRRDEVRRSWRRAAAAADANLIALGAVGLDGDAGWATERGPERPEGDALGAVLVSHFPLVAHTDRLAAAGLPCPGELAERAALLERTVATGVPTVVLSGHVHVRDAVSHGSVLQVSVAALVEPPHEAAIVEVDPLGELVRCTRIGGTAAGDGATDRAGAGAPWLLAPAEESWDFIGGGWTRRLDPVLAEARP